MHRLNPPRENARRNLSMGPFPSSSLCIFLYKRPPSLSLFGYFRFSTKSPPLYPNPPSLSILLYIIRSSLPFFSSGSSLLLSFYPPTPTPSIPSLLKPLGQLLFQPPKRAVAIPHRPQSLPSDLQKSWLLFHKKKGCAICFKLLRNVPICSNMMTGSVKWTNTGWWPWLTCLSSHSQRIFIRRM